MYTSLKDHKKNLGRAENFSYDNYDYYNMHEDI